MVLTTFIKYLLHTIDLNSENPWENKAVYMLYTELFTGALLVLHDPVPAHVWSRPCSHVLNVFAGLHPHSPRVETSAVESGVDPATL